MPTQPGFCLDCLTETSGLESRCHRCHSPRLKRHAELHDLSIAHIDCDAFYASVEKRDRPELADKPVIIGGGTRGVVSTACYVARIAGVKSAMPMFKALKLCPQAIVIRPDIAKYVAVSRKIRELMVSVTPLVEPLSIDEAFVDLTGTSRLHGKSPVLTLATLLKRIEVEVGVTASAGLSHNKYLAKLASDLEKPRGLSLIGQVETLEFLKDKSVSFIWGVGKAFQETLSRDGIATIGQLQKMDLSTLVKRYGVMGSRLYYLARGQDNRTVSTDDESKSISAETTFNVDVSDYPTLERHLWRLCEKVSTRAKAENQAGSTITLKLKTNDFKTRSRSTSLDDPTLMAHHIFSASQPLLKKEAIGITFRLIGIGISRLHPQSPEQIDTQLDSRHLARSKAERAVDKLRQKFGVHSVERGLGFTPPTSPHEEDKE